MPPSTKEPAKKAPGPSSPVLPVCCSHLANAVSGVTRVHDHGTPVLSSGRRWWLARVGQQNFDVLNPEARIGAVEPDGRIVVVQCPLIERLGVLRDWGWRRANRHVERGCRRRRPRSPLRNPGCTSRKSPSKIVKKPIRLFSKGTKSEKCTVPTVSNPSWPFSPTRAFPTNLKAKPCRRDLKGHVGQQGALRGIARKARRTRGRLDVLYRSVLVSEIRIERLTAMMLEPFRGPSHGYSAEAVQEGRPRV